MGYLVWFNSHAAKHKVLMQKLAKLDKNQIIEYFDYENMKLNEPDFCVLYAKNKKCHDVENLNCYLCACPNFRFNDNGFNSKDGNLLLSFCAINSKDGAQIVSKNCIHQDCTKCSVPHLKDYISNNFSLNWYDVMRDCAC